MVAEAPLVLQAWLRSGNTAAGRGVTAFLREALALLPAGYLVKMLIYLSLIEVYRARAIDAKAGSTVHCVLDETGILAPKYVRDVLAYATKRGIILITAGHSQQTKEFDHWVRVRKHGPRFGAQTVLRRVLRCD